MNLNYLHPQDSIKLMLLMKNGSVTRWANAVKKYFDKNLEDITINEWVEFKNKNWFRCKGLGGKSITDFNNALKTLNIIQ